MTIRRVLSAILLLFFTACAAKEHAAAPAASSSPSATPTPLINARGVTMPLEKAVHEIAFRPFIPRAQISAFAAIPPLGGTDKRESHGLAIEYARDGHTMLLSQWPRGNFEVAIGQRDITNRPCAPVAYSADGLLWTTRNGLVMTLQPDGTVAASSIALEARRLLHAGACVAG
jgi:hypothetical protein